MKKRRDDVVAAREPLGEINLGDVLDVAEGCDTSIPAGIYDNDGNAYRLWEAKNEGGQLVITIEGPLSWSR